MNTYWVSAERVGILLCAGAIALLIGGIMVADNWPGVELTTTGYPPVVSTKSTGDADAALVGLVIAGVGQICLMISVIAIGVRLGGDVVQLESKSPEDD